MAEPAFTDETGAPIPEDQLASALSSGQAFGDPDAEYRMKDETGAIVKVRGGEVPNALAAGATLLSPSESAFEDRRPEYVGTGAAARTLLERGVSTATGGLSDLAAGLASPELAQGMRERAQVQDSAGAIGGAIGAAVPLSLAGKLAKPLQKVASLVKPSTPIGRMALRAASEAAPLALEGALYGGTSAAGSAALNGQEITAEKVMAGAGQGALFGGLLGVATGAGSRALQRIAGKADDAAEAVAKSAKTADGGKVPAGLADLKISTRRLKEKVGRNARKIDDTLAEVNQDYLGYTMKSGPMKGKRIHHGARDPVDVIDDVTHAWNETGREVQRFRDAADEIGRADARNLPDAMALNQKLDEVVGSIASDPFSGRAAKRLARKIEKDHLEPLRQWRDRGAADPIEQAQALGVGNLAEPAKDISPRLRQAYEGATPEQAQAIATGQSPPMGTADKIPPIKLELTPAGPRVAEGQGRIAAAKAAGAAEVLATVKKPDGSEWTGPVSIEGRPVTPDGAPSLGQLDRIRQGIGDELAAAKRAGKKDEIRALSQVYGSFTDAIDTTIERTLAPQGISLAEFKEAKRVYSSLSLVKGAIDDLKFAQARGTPQPKASDEAGLAYAFTSLLTGNFGAAASSAARAIGGKLLGDSLPGTLAGGAAKSTAMLELGARAIASGSRVAARELPKAASSGLRYAMRVRPEETVTELREITSSPQRIMQYAADRTSDIAPAYPDLAMQMQKLIVGDLQYLAQTAPPGFREQASALTPSSRSKAVYSHPEVQKWLARAEALENPAEVVRSLVEGEIQFETIEALKARRPQMWNELRQGVAAELAVRPDDVPFKRRIFLGTAFEFPADYSMTPDVAAELQAPPVAAGAEGQAQARGGKVTVDANQAMTVSQRLEEF